MEHTHSAAGLHPFNTGARFQFRVKVKLRSEASGHIHSTHERPFAAGSPIPGPPFARFAFDTQLATAPLQQSLESWNWPGRQTDDLNWIPYEMSLPHLLVFSNSYVPSYHELPYESWDINLDGIIRSKQPVNRGKLPNNGIPAQPAPSSLAILLWGFVCG